MPSLFQLILVAYACARYNVTFIRLAAVVSLVLLECFLPSVRVQYPIH